MVRSVGESRMSVESDQKRYNHFVWGVLAAIAGAILVLASPLAGGGITLP